MTIGQRHAAATKRILAETGCYVALWGVKGSANYEAWDLTGATYGHTNHLIATGATLEDAANAALIALANEHRSTK